ncbi:hypothetical protein R3P38DRAFT_3194937 [Favolaschia claudopus]|uniref:Uncharacterized protein n=1 Tax=Favolaschia claudopus TaxID=2862362 RepID=A0AAW0B9Y1_9AGAR
MADILWAWPRKDNPQTFHRQCSAGRAFTPVPCDPADIVSAPPLFFILRAHLTPKQSGSRIDHGLKRWIPPRVLWRIEGQCAKRDEGRGSSCTFAPLSPEDANVLGGFHPSTGIHTSHPPLHIHILPTSKTNSRHGLRRPIASGDAGYHVLFTLVPISVLSRRLRHSRPHPLLQQHHKVDKLECIIVSVALIQFICASALSSFPSTSAVYWLQASAQCHPDPMSITIDARPPPSNAALSVLLRFYTCARYR